MAHDPSDRMVSMHWKKYNRKLLWCFFGFLIAVALIRVTPPFWYIAIHKRVFYDEKFPQFRGDENIELDGYEVHSRFGRGELRGVVTWNRLTGLLHSRMTVVQGPDGLDARRITIWSFDGEIDFQRIVTAEFTETFYDPPWRWGEKPRTPATWWMKAQWLPY